MRIWLIVLGALGLSFAVFQGIRASFPANREPALARFFTVPSSTVTRINLRPASPPYASPIAAPIAVTNPQAIDRILRALRPTTEVKLNHPSTLTRYEIEIVTASGSSYGTIDNTANQGVILHVQSGPSDGLYYGAFQNDRLAGLLQIASSSE